MEEEGDEEAARGVREGVRAALLAGDEDEAKRIVDDAEERFDIAEWRPRHIHLLVEVNKFRMASGSQSVYKRCRQSTLLSNQLGGWFVKVASRNRKGNCNYEYVPNPIFVGAYESGNGLQVFVCTSIREAHYANLVMQKLLLPRIASLSELAVAAVDAHL